MLDSDEFVHGMDKNGYGYDIGDGNGGEDIERITQCPALEVPKIHLLSKVRGEPNAEEINEPLNLGEGARVRACINLGVYKCGRV